MGDTVGIVGAGSVAIADSLETNNNQSGHYLILSLSSHSKSLLES